MKVNVHHNIGALAKDQADIVAKAPAALTDTVRDGIRLGNELGRDFARKSSGTHARKYPGTFSARMNTSFLGFGSGIYRGEYGPVARGQGLLGPILERGSRNNKPHFNLAKSADIIGPAFGKEVGDTVERLFR